MNFAQKMKLHKIKTTKNPYLNKYKKYEREVYRGNYFRTPVLSITNNKPKSNLYTKLKI